MTITVNLPRLNQTGTNEWSDVESNDVALKEGIEKAGEEIDAITGITWYTPKVIATEQTRESTEFGFLATEDKIANVVLPENGLILVGYQAAWKTSSTEATKGRAAIFLGSNQVKIATSGTNAPAAQEAVTGNSASNKFSPLVSSMTKGLYSPYESGEYSGDVTTGQVLGGSLSGSSGAGGPAVLFAAAGTYTVGIKYKATSGSVTVKERKLFVATLG